LKHHLSKTTYDQSYGPNASKDVLSWWSMYSAAETETSIDSSWICGQLTSSAGDKHAEELQILSLSELRCGGMASRFLSILEVGWWDGGMVG
jgi:hypothetical protein